MFLNMRHIGRQWECFRSEADRGKDTLLQQAIMEPPDQIRRPDVAILLGVKKDGHQT